MSKKTTSIKTVLPSFTPVAVVDIGSNSVRLVVYDGLRRAPSPVFNEKVLCGLGRGVAATGMMNQKGVERALVALARFGALCEQIGVGDCFAIATAAAREAKNGPQFIKDAQLALGREIKVLTGKEEAEFAAMGIVSSIPDADGVVGDLGGGSLELVDVKDGKNQGGVTLPLGPFRLMDAIEESGRDPKEIVEEALIKTGMMEAIKGRRFYAVGGAWRSLAKLHMQQSAHPLSVLQQYTIVPTAARSVSILVGGMAEKELKNTDIIAKKRAETLPLAALVLDRLLTLGQPDEVVFSAFGVREGVLFAKLPDDKKSSDPLLAGCWDFARRYARSPEHEEELRDWTDDLFGNELFEESKADKKMRHAACLLADIGWRASPDYRGPRALNLITQANIVGVDHPGRAFLALTIFYRYQGPVKTKAPDNLASLITNKTNDRARQVAAILRLAYCLTAAMPGTLPKLKLALNDKKILQLTLPESLENLIGEIVDKRLEQLADLIDCKAEIVIKKNK